MRRYKNRQSALDYADESDLTFGFCVLNGFYYVGNLAQIEDIGCINISYPLTSTYSAYGMSHDN